MIFLKTKLMIENKKLCLMQHIFVSVAIIVAINKIDKPQADIVGKLYILGEADDAFGKMTEMFHCD